MSTDLLWNVQECSGFTESHEWNLPVLMASGGYNVRDIDVIATTSVGNLILIACSLFVQDKLVYGVISLSIDTSINQLSLHSFSQLDEEMTHILPLTSDLIVCLISGKFLRLSVTAMGMEIKSVSSPRGDFVVAAAISSDDKMCLTYKDGSVVVWDARSFSELLNAKLDDCATSVVWIEEMKRFFIGYGTYDSRICYITDMSILTFLPWNAPLSPITSFAMVDGHLLVGFEGNQIYDLFELHHQTHIGENITSDRFVTAIDKLVYQNKLLIVSGLSDITVYEYNSASKTLQLRGHLDEADERVINPTEFMTFAPMVSGSQVFCVSGSGIVRSLTF